MNTVKEGVKVKISLAGYGKNCKPTIEVEGVEISKHCRSIELSAAVHDVVTLKVELYPSVVEIEGKILESALMTRLFPSPEDIHQVCDWIQDVITNGIDYSDNSMRRTIRGTK